MKSWLTASDYGESVNETVLLIEEKSNAQCGFGHLHGGDNFCGRYEGQNLQGSQLFPSPHPAAVGFAVLTLRHALVRARD